MYCTLAEFRRRATQATTATLPDAELSALIEQASRYFDLVVGVEPEYFEPAYYPLWESLHVYVVGDIITPTTRNLHKYRVTTAGTSGASEPTFPTSAAATVTNGSVVFTENGADVVATARTFRGEGTNYLRIDPYVIGTLSATIGVPTNYTAPTFVALGSNYLVLTDSNGFTPQGQWRYPPYTTGWWEGSEITVTAIWGFASTPEDVKEIVLEIAINFWRGSDPAAAKITDLDIQLLRRDPFRLSRIATKYRLQTGAAFA